MKKSVITLILTSTLYINLLYGEGNNTAVIVSPIQSSSNVEIQKERIKNKFIVIDELLARINELIEDIDELKVSIKLLIEHKNMEMVCASISSFNEEIIYFKKEISTVIDKERKAKLETKIALYASLLDEEKTVLNNYTCSE
jgi:hypothetical protein